MGNPTNDNVMDYFERFGAELKAVLAAGPYLCKIGCGGTAPYPNRVCDECARRAEHERERREREYERSRVMPRRFTWARFDAPEMKDRVIDAARKIKSAQLALDALRAGKARNLVFFGRAGCGKTSLAHAALSSEIIDRGVTSAASVAAMEIGLARRDSDLGETPKIIDTACVKRIVLLDDIGSEPANTRDAVREVLHWRYDSDLPLIITCGFTRDWIAEAYGAGTARRVLEDAAVIEWKAA